jgi:hypothetical protein
MLDENEAKPPAGLGEHQAEDGKGRANIAARSAEIDGGKKICYPL